MNAMKKAPSFLASAWSTTKDFLKQNKKDARALICVLLFTIVFTLLLINVPGYRPHLIAFVAAVGAAFAAMPNLVSDTVLVRWVTAVVSGVCVGLGTWYTAVELDHQKEALQSELNKQEQQSRDQLRRFDVLHSAFLAAARDVPAEQGVRPITNIANLMQTKFSHGQYADVFDLSYWLLEVYPDNGHALYYTGETWRVNIKDRSRIQLNMENMRGWFKQYIAKADVIPESRDGAREACYHRASGFCGERTAWILHMMANDAYREGMKLADPSRRSYELERALGYAKQALKIRAKGFEKTTSFEATIVVRDIITNELTVLRKNPGAMPKSGV